MSITPEEVEQAVREWARAASSKDRIAEAVAMEAEAAGFGSGTRAWRDIAARGSYAQILAAFWDQYEYYRAEWLELHTAVKCDIGFAWGFYTVEAKKKGGPPERWSDRCSYALAKEADGWKMLSFHRDSQEFDADGRRPVLPASVEPGE